MPYTMKTTPTGVDKAVFKAGSQSALARTMGIKPQAVQQWVKAGRVPGSRAKAVSKKTNVPLDELLPD